ncbi:phytanoyl-CoA dioxygenase [Xylaria venustula]|nr:phytanoyl-CoA dioxygenase [Xylaria venustula]
MTGGLTPSQLADFERNGYLIVPNALPPTTVEALLAETHKLLEDFSLADHPMTKFSTGEKSEHVGDDYFLSSGDKVRFFFEEDAFSPETGELVKPKARAINKIGHYLHALSPPFASLLDPALNPDLLGGASSTGSVAAGHRESHPAAIARALGFADPRVLQSMVICKQPEIGGAVPPHQDSTFLYTDPPSAVGFWYALEDATAENGCLSFLPGSHRWAPVRQRFVRAAGNSGTEFMDNVGPRFPAGDEYGEDKKDGGKDGEEYVMGEVKAGSLVLIHGNLLHKSERNTSQKGRIIYTFHVIEGDGTTYDERNWLQPPTEGFTKLFRD